MPDSTPHINLDEAHDQAERLVEGVELVTYPDQLIVARAYLHLEERYEQMRGFRDECERQYQAKLDEVNGLIEQLEATREALRGVFVWVEVPDSSMGDADWRKREEAMREAQRILTSNPASEPACQSWGHQHGECSCFPPEVRTP